MWNPVDWSIFCRAWRMWSGGGNPYLVPGFFSPPWLLILPALFGWMPMGAGGAIMVILNVFGLGLAAWQQKLSLWDTLSLFASFPFLAACVYGNIDGLVIGSVLWPAWGALPVLALKPHLTIGAMVVLAVRSIKARRWIDFVPLGGLMAISLVLFGFWPVTWWGAGRFSAAYGFNVAGSAWPYLFVVGAAIFVEAVRTDDPILGLAAGAFLSPHLTGNALIGVWFVAAVRMRKTRYAFVVACLVFWMIYLLSRHYFP